ncbi:MAG: hypothetical protein HYS25_00365 [Ignavibacteriales bacterium]|nr:hypothetical protein [Ignavibacteriales bacterium]
MGNGNDDFRDRVKEKLKENREAFEGQYKDELSKLLGLSKDEIKKITPDGTGMEVYQNLISVVQEASRVNLSQAELKTRIAELGSVAIEISKMVAPLAKLFV